MHEKKTPVPPSAAIGIQSCVGMVNFQLGSKFIFKNPKKERSKIFLI